MLSCRGASYIRNKEENTPLWCCWIFANNTITRVKKSCAWPELSGGEFNTSEKLRLISVFCWMSTVNFRHSNSSCKILGSITVIRWQKQANPRHVYLFKIPRSFNVGGLNMAKRHHHRKSCWTLKMQTTFFLNYCRRWKVCLNRS